jgi:hypothetical protein
MSESDSNGAAPIAVDNLQNSDGSLTPPVAKRQRRKNDNSSGPVTIVALTSGFML